jgi:hypothetical protein
MLIDFLSKPGEYILSMINSLLLKKTVVFNLRRACVKADNSFIAGL